MNIKDIKTTCAVTGHRNLETDFDYERLRRIFTEVIARGFDTFIIGMAVGFDTACFETLYAMKKKSGIKIIACVPCENQDARFSSAQKKKYRELLAKADETEILAEKHVTGCMHKRNKVMVDNSDLLVAYLNRSSGGTYFTVNYARQSGKEIIFV